MSNKKIRRMILENAQRNNPWVIPTGWASSEDKQHISSATDAFAIGVDTRQEIKYLLDKGYITEDTIGVYSATCKIKITSDGIDWLESQKINLWAKVGQWIAGRLDQILTAAAVALVTTLVTNWLTKK